MLNEKASSQWMAARLRKRRAGINGSDRAKRKQNGAFQLAAPGAAEGIGVEGERHADRGQILERKGEDHAKLFLAAVVTDIEAEGGHPARKIAMQLVGLR